MKEDKIVMPELKTTEILENYKETYINVCEFFTCPAVGCDFCAVYSLENFKKYKEQNES